MSELEDLPSWAGRSTDEPPPEAASVLGDKAEPPPIEPPEEERRRRLPVALLALLGIAALIALGAIGFLLADSDGSSETETAGEADDTEADGGTLASDEVTADDPAATGDDATTDSATADDTLDDADDTGDDAAATDGGDGEDADPAAADGGATTDGDATSGDSTLNDSGRQAVYRDGKVYLSGTVPSEEVGQIIEQKAAAVVGPDNVVNEYEIDPAAVIEPGESAPIFVEDVVLFGFNSIEIAPPFLPILDLGVLLLSQNPQASVTVITRTDAVGSEEVNLEVATRRAQSVVDYWLSKGVDRDQIKTDPRGEELASDSDDAETAALNRRAEFVITGLLD